MAMAAFVREIILLEALRVLARFAFCTEISRNECVSKLEPAFGKLKEIFTQLEEVSAELKRIEALKSKAHF